MNDYYSESLPPSESEIKNMLLNEMKKKNPNCKEADIVQCVNKAFEDFGGMKNIGSLTGWLMFSKKELLQIATALLNCKMNKTLYPNLHTQTL